MCFLIYGIKRRSGHDWSQSLGPIWHVSGPKIGFWRNDIMILHHFCRRSLKIKLFWPKTLIFDTKSQKYDKHHWFFFGIFGILGQILRLLVKITWFLSFSGKNDAESLCHFVKIPFLDPKLSLIHIWRCRRYSLCRSRWSPYH